MRIPKMSQFKGVLFDLDGVIIDSEPIHNLKWSEVLNDLGIHRELSWFERFTGVSDKFTAQEIAKTFELTTSYEELLRNKQLKYRQYIESDVTPIPDLTDAIKSLHKFRLGLVTASDRVEAEIITRALGINNLFDVIVGGDEVLNNKPNPDIYLKAASHIDVIPQLCIAVEDSCIGVMSAKSAGLFVIGVTNSPISSELEKADYLCMNTLEAISYIKTLN